MESATNQQQHDSFVRLLSGHARDVFNFILSLSPNRSDAEDIFQNASVVLWKKFDTYVPGTSFRAWAYQVAYFEVVEYRRRKSKLRRLFSDEAFQALASDALTETGELDVREDALAGCLQKLPPADRRLIERRYFSAQSTQEIADRMAKSVPTVYRSLARVHDALLHCVERTLQTEQAQQ